MKKDIDALSLTRKLVTFNTINPPGDERNAARYLGELLKESGFEVKLPRLCHRPNQCGRTTSLRP